MFKANWLMICRLWNFTVFFDRFNIFEIISVQILFLISFNIIFIGNNQKVEPNPIFVSLYISTIRS